MTYQLQVAGSRLFSLGQWRNAISYYLEGIQDVNMVIRPEISFLTTEHLQKIQAVTKIICPDIKLWDTEMALRLNTKKWFYFLACKPDFQFVEEPCPAFTERIEIVGNQQLDVESSLLEFSDTTLTQMLILLLPPKKLILWKNDKQELLFQVDNISSSEKEAFYKL